MIEETHQRVRRILADLRKFLDDLAHLLSKEEIVQGEELRKMLSESSPGEASPVPVPPS
jgi:cell division protease FtsH